MNIDAAAARLIALPLAALLGAVVAGQSVPARLPPADEGPKDSSFVTFRRGLIAAAKAGNVEVVRSMMIPEPLIHDPVDEPSVNSEPFAQRWGLETDPRPFLNELADVLAHGGRFIGKDLFLAPYWFTDFPGEAEQLAAHAVVIRKSAPVFAKPDQRSQTLAHLSYAVVKNAVGPNGFNDVTLSDGRRGYVRDGDIRLPSGARAYFRKLDGEWKLIAFTEGLD